MNWFHTALRIFGYAATVGVPALAVAVPAIGIPMWLIGAITTAGGVALHLAPSPVTPQAVADAVAKAVSKQP
jgi:hypothetical protein